MQLTAYEWQSQFSSECGTYWFCVQCLSEAERRGDVASMDFGVKQDRPDHPTGSNKVWSGVDGQVYLHDAFAKG